MKKTYDIYVDCANCAQKMEDTANKVEGVAQATVSFMTQKMEVKFDEGVDAGEVIQKVLEECQKVESDCEIYL